MINPIITLAPGELSTWKPPVDTFYEQIDNFTVGEIWSDPSGIPGTDGDFAAGFAPLDVNDLACPTWGLGISTSADGTVVTTIGPPWLPLIGPPEDIFSLDPIWAAGCTGLFTDSFGLTTLALFDPPIALTPAVLLASTSPASPTQTPVSTPAALTTTSGLATPSADPAKPASLPNGLVAPPARTEESGRASLTQSPVIASVDPASLPNSLTASPDNEADPPSDPPSNPKVLSASAVAGDPLAEPLALSSSAADPPSGDSHQLPTDPKEPTVPGPVQGESPQIQSQGLGAIIYNAFGGTGPNTDRPSSSSLPPQSIFTIGAQTFTANPTGFRVNNAAIIPGGPGHTIDGTSISLGQWGILTVGSNTISFTTSSSTTVLAVAGQTFTPNPSVFSIGGSIVSAGGAAVIVDGTTISLDHSGALAIGSTIISLTDPSSTPLAAKAFTVAGQTFTPNPSAFFIAGTTISVGGPAVTIDGTTISLGPSGALAIGGSTVDLPTLTYTPSKAYTVADQKFTPNPSAFPIAGTILSAGGPAATVNGTTISLQPSGTLIVGSSTIPLLASQVSSDVTIDGYDVKAQSSFVVVDGIKLNAATAGVTISGQVVSLEAGGKTLDIGTGRFALPTGAVSGSVNVQAFTGGQGQKGVDLSIFFLICGVCGIVMLLV